MLNCAGTFPSWNASLSRIALITTFSALSKLNRQSARVQDSISQVPKKGHERNAMD